jgi:hypothetical protein
VSFVFLRATNEEALEILLAVAAGECTREEVEVFFREKTQTQ